MAEDQPLASKEFLKIVFGAVLTVAGSIAVAYIVASWNREKERFELIMKTNQQIWAIQNQMQEMIKYVDRNRSDLNKLFEREELRQREYDKLRLEISENLHHVMTEHSKEVDAALRDSMLYITSLQKAVSDLNSDIQVLNNEVRTLHEQMGRKPDPPKGLHDRLGDRLGDVLPRFYCLECLGGLPA